jgi:hypothetical protein
MLFVYEQGITTLQIKDGTKVLEDNKDILIPVYLPTTASLDFKEKISGHFRTKRFDLNKRNDLLREVP